MIYDFLNKPRNILTEIWCEEARMEGLRYSMYPSAIRYDVDKVQTSPSGDLLPRYAAEIDGIQDHIKQLQIAYKKALDEITERAKCLEGAERYVIMYRYVAQWTWQEIAYKLDRTEDAVHKIRRKAVKILAEKNPDL